MYNEKYAIISWKVFEDIRELSTNLIYSIGFKEHNYQTPCTYIEMVDINKINS